MPHLINYRIDVESPGAVDEFVREYVLDAIDRSDDWDDCEFITFAPARNPETGDRRSVVVGYAGDPEAVFEREKDRLTAHQEDGVVEGWEKSHEFTRDEMAEMMGEQSAPLQNRMAELSGSMAKLAYETFEEFPAAVDEFPDEAGVGPVGWWVVLHTLTVQANYDLEEELDAYMYGIEHTLRNIAEFEGEDAATERLTELTKEIEEMHDSVTEGRLGP